MKQSSANSGVPSFPEGLSSVISVSNLYVSSSLVYSLPTQSCFKQLVLELGLQLLIGEEQGQKHRLHLHTLFSFSFFIKFLLLTMCDLILYLKFWRQNEYRNINIGQNEGGGGEEKKEGLVLVKKKGKRRKQEQKDI